MFRRKQLLKNVFGGDHKKHVLLSYIRAVFDQNNYRDSKSHTNYHTTYCIARQLDALGYNVDVVDWQQNYLGDYSKYSLVVGLGKTLDQILCTRRTNTPKVVWFGTGCNPQFSNIETMRRLKAFYEKTGVMAFESTRFVKEDTPLQHELADGIILHGAEFAMSTYSNENITPVLGPVHILNESIPEKDFSRVKNNYLWFGSGGLIHKGLDLAIESFMKRPNLHLKICGDIERESSFYEVYKDKISITENISYHGFVDINSNEFLHIMQDTAFIVYPSVSEGNSPSVLTCMANGGLIPIVSQGADLERMLKTEIIQIEDLTVDSIIAALDRSQKLTESDMTDASIRIANYTKCNHSFQAFENSIYNSLNNLMTE